MDNFEDTIDLKSRMNELINNIELKNFIKFKIDKDIFTKNDLENIDEIILDSKNIIGDYNKVYFDEINLFPNLKKISIRNLGISEQNMSKLANIKEIEFINCEIPSFEKIKNAQNLKIINSYIEKFDSINELTDLEELHLINLKLNDFTFIKSFKNLKKLAIKNINDFSLSNINYVLPIEYLSIENINKIDLQIISQYERLIVLSVDRKESEKFKEELKTLHDKGIQILLNDQYEY